MIKYLEKPDVILTMLVIIDILLILGSVLFKLGPEYITFILLFDAIVCIVLIIEFIRKLQKSENRQSQAVPHRRQEYLNYKLLKRSDRPFDAGGYFFVAKIISMW